MAIMSLASFVFEWETQGVCVTRAVATLQKQSWQSTWLQILAVGADTLLDIPQNVLRALHSLN